MFQSFLYLISNFFHSIIFVSCTAIWVTSPPFWVHRTEKSFEDRVEYMLDADSSYIQWKFFRLFNFGEIGWFSDLSGSLFVFFFWIFFSKKVLLVFVGSITKIHISLSKTHKWNFGIVFLYIIWLIHFTYVLHLSMVRAVRDSVAKC